MPKSAYNILSILFWSSILIFTFFYFRKQFLVRMNSQRTVGYVFHKKEAGTYNTCELSFFYKVGSKIYAYAYNTHEPNCKKHSIGEKYQVRYNKRNPAMCFLIYDRPIRRSEYTYLDSIWESRKRIGFQ